MKKFLLITLIVIVALLAIYAFYPKYQIQMVKLDNETVMITQINVLTGQTETYHRTTKPLDIYTELGL